MRQAPTPAALDEFANAGDPSGSTFKFTRRRSNAVTGRKEGQRWLLVHQQSPLPTSLSYAGRRAGHSQDVRPDQRVCDGAASTMAWTCRRIFWTGSSPLVICGASNTGYVFSHNNGTAAAGLVMVWEAGADNGALDQLPNANDRVV